MGLSRPPSGPGLTTVLATRARPWLALVVLLCCSLAACAAARPPLAASSATSPSAEPTLLQFGPSGLRDARSLTWTEVRDRLKGVDYLLVGEGHTIVCDHVLQARLIEALALLPQPPALGLEMVSQDRQKVLDQFNAATATSAERDIPSLLDRLPRDLNWPKLWGHAYSLYRPMFEAAARARLPLYGLNLPSEVLREYRICGPRSLLPEQARWLPTRLIPAPKAQREALHEEFKRHQTMLSASSKRSGLRRSHREQNFLEVQALWDSTMAEAAARVRHQSQRPLVILAGAGHVDHGWGIAYRLREFDPGCRILIISPWRGSPAPEEGQGDLFFYCPDEHQSRLGFTVEWQAPRALVTSLVPGGLAAKAGLQAGDAIVLAEDKALTGLSDLHVAAVQARQSGRPLVLQVERQGASVAISLDLPR